MANRKLTDPAVPSVTSLNDEDLFYVVTDPSGHPVSKKITAANLKAFLGNDLLIVTDSAGASWLFTVNTDGSWQSTPYSATDPLSPILSEDGLHYMVNEDGTHYLSQES